jgi:hypothetical protein
VGRLRQVERGAPYYDVLYFDKNGDGDLTAPTERFVGKRD